MRDVFVCESRSSLEFRFTPFFRSLFLSPPEQGLCQVVCPPPACNGGMVVVQAHRLVMATCSPRERAHADDEKLELGACVYIMVRSSIELKVDQLGHPFSSSPYAMSRVLVDGEKKKPPKRKRNDGGARG